MQAGQDSWMNDGVVYLFLARFGEGRSAFYQGRLADAHVTMNEQIVIVIVRILRRMKMSED